MLLHSCLACEIMTFPTPYGRGRTANTVVNRHRGFEYHVREVVDVHVTQGLTVCCPQQIAFGCDAHFLLVLHRVGLYGSVAGPNLAALIHIAVRAVLLAYHLNHIQGLRIGVVAFRSSLKLEIITFYQVLEHRVLDLPLQLVITGIGAGLVQLFRRFEVIDAVVRQYIHRRTLQGRGVACRIVFDFEISRHLLNDGVRGHYEDVSRPLRLFQHDLLLRSLRCAIGERLVEQGIGNTGIAVTRHSVLVERVQERREQLRRGEHVARIKTAEVPVEVVPFFLGLRPVDMRIDLDIDLSLPVHRRGWVPVELQESHLRTVVIFLLIDVQPFRPLVVTGDKIRRTGSHRGDLNTTHVRCHLEEH